MTSPILFPLLADNPTLVFLRKREADLDEFNLLILLILTLMYLHLCGCLPVSDKKMRSGAQRGPLPPPKLTLSPVPLIPSFSSPTYYSAGTTYLLSLLCNCLGNTSKLYSILKSHSNTGVPFLTLLSPLSLFIAFLLQ